MSGTDYYGNMSLCFPVSLQDLPLNSLLPTDISCSRAHSDVGYSLLTIL